jgi:ketosteroid isomerase-like protein
MDGSGSPNAAPNTWTGTRRRIVYDRERPVIQKRMGQVATVILVGAVLGGCTGSGVGDAGMSDSERVAVVEEAEAAIASMFDAMNAGDAEAVLEYYSAGPFIRISCTQIQDPGEFRIATELYYRTRDSLQFHYHVIGSRALSPDAAVVSASGGLPEVDGLFWTWVLEREEGQMKVVHEHESWAGCPEIRQDSFHNPIGEGESIDGSPDG